MSLLPHLCTLLLLLLSIFLSILCDKLDNFRSTEINDFIVIHVI